jgi:hypothetical protein
MESHVAKPLQVVPNIGETHIQKQRSLWVS